MSAKGSLSGCPVGYGVVETAAGDPVKNRDLWERLCAATQRHMVEWCWVKAHNGDSDNERVDVLARGQAMAQRSTVASR